MEIITFIIIALTVGVSLYGFSDKRFFARYKFSTYAIEDMRQIDRLLTSGFLHVDTMHLLFNIFALYFFSDVVIGATNVFKYVVIYFAAILMGNLVSLWIYRRDMTYTAVGASGGVAGIIFASIAIYPSMTLMIFPLPIPLPGWVFGIGYLLYSVYGMSKNLGNIGHTAHLGGAVMGLMLAIAFDPQILFINGYYIALMLVPILGLAYYIYKEK